MFSIFPASGPARPTARPREQRRGPTSLAWGRSLLACLLTTFSLTLVPAQATTGKKEANKASSSQSAKSSRKGKESAKLEARGKADKPAAQHAGKGAAKDSKDAKVSRDSKSARAGNVKHARAERDEADERATRIGKSGKGDKLAKRSDKDRRLAAVDKSDLAEKAGKNGKSRLSAKAQKAEAQRLAAERRAEAEAERRAEAAAAQRRAEAEAERRAAAQAQAERDRAVREQAAVQAAQIRALRRAAEERVQARLSAAGGDRAAMLPAGEVVSTRYDAAPVQGATSVAIAPISVAPAVVPTAAAPALFRAPPPAAPPSAGRASYAQRAGLHGTEDVLGLSASAALVIDQDTQQVLLSKNDHAVLPIASLTKLMTGLLISEARLPMDEPITITQQDVDSLKGTRSRLPVGTTLSRGELLHLALMSSENRAAHALGRTYPGGLQRFVGLMNTRALMLGMRETRYVEPTGLSPQNQSSATDLSILVSAAARDSLLRALTTSAGYEIGVGNRTLQYNNTNRLVHRPEWNIGLQKTGYISEAGHNLVMQAQVAGRRLIMVFLDASGKSGRLADAERVRQWLQAYRHGDVMAAGPEHGAWAQP